MRAQKSRFDVRESIESKSSISIEVHVMTLDSHSTQLAVSTRAHCKSLFLRKSCRRARKLRLAGGRDEQRRRGLRCVGVVREAKR